MATGPKAIEQPCICPTW